MRIEFRVKPYGTCSFYIGDTHPFSRYVLKTLDQSVPKIDKTTKLQPSKLHAMVTITATLQIFLL